jgi:hypothetical protein
MEQTCRVVLRFRYRWLLSFPVTLAVWPVAVVDIMVVLANDSLPLAYQHILQVEAVIIMRELLLQPSQPELQEQQGPALHMVLEDQL